MSKAFKCDSCGEYCDGEPTIMTLHPNERYKKVLIYDLCPFCFNEVIELVIKEKVYGDID